MITKEELDNITFTLKEQVFKNEKIMHLLKNKEDYILFINNQYTDVIDIIASLHNLLYEAVTGNKYDYMWHWANKIGAWCEDNLFKVGEDDEQKRPI